MDILNGLAHKIKFSIDPSLIDTPAINQIITAAEIDQVSQIAVMPDAHPGYSLPVGGVAVVDGYICPRYVGVDIGCGMCHIATHIKADELHSLKTIHDKIKSEIPCGVGKEHSIRYEIPCGDFSSWYIPSQYHQHITDKARTQSGTLGSGNHFIEIGVNSRGYVGVTIHSGSRRPGMDIATHWVDLCEIHGVALNPKDPKTKFLDITSDAGVSYYQDMKWAEEFAFNNRSHMMAQVLRILGYDSHEVITAMHRSMINITHNHAVLMEGTKVLHRKGSTPAENGQIGIIPINMKDGTYITRGLGNTEYLCSASHGAGRVMGRKKAAKAHSIETLRKEMVGVYTNITPAILDEGPWAYKNADFIIKTQENNGMIEVVDHFKPIIAVKGD